MVGVDSAKATIMDALLPYRPYERVVVMRSSQIGKTEKEVEDTAHSRAGERSSIGRTPLLRPVPS
jgi:hypothetical protein